MQEWENSCTVSVHESSSHYYVDFELLASFLAWSIISATFPACNCKNWTCFTVFASRHEVNAALAPAVLSLNHCAVLSLNHCAVLSLNHCFVCYAGEWAHVYYFSADILALGNQTHLAFDCQSLSYKTETQLISAGLLDDYTLAECLKSLLLHQSSLF